MNVPARRPSRPGFVAPLTSAQVTTYENEVEPRYVLPFARMLLAKLPAQTGGTILDVASGGGRQAAEILSQVAPTARVVCVERDPLLSEVARKKMSPEDARRVSHKVDTIGELSFGDAAFDVVFANLSLGRYDQWHRILADFRRILAPGGLLLLATPLRGSFDEGLDMLRELSLKHDVPVLAERADLVSSRLPDPTQLIAAARAAGFTDIELEEDDRALSFRGAWELFDDDLARFVVMPDWLEAAAADGRTEERMEQLQRSLEVYLGIAALSVSFTAGALRATKPL